MTASELGARLQELIAIHGDLEVFAACASSAEICVTDADHHSSGPLRTKAPGQDGEAVPERILLTGALPE